jgi:hypothetical protein
MPVIIQKGSNVKQLAEYLLAFCCEDDNGKTVILENDVSIRLEKGYEPKLHIVTKLT